MITQEHFDETVLENQECFDLSPEEAVAETIDQLRKQQAGGGNINQTTKHNATKNTHQSLLGHIFQTHPESPQGKDDREACQTLLESLEALDVFIPVNGRPVIDDGSEQLKQILKHLSFIQKSCTAVKKRSTADINANEVEEEEKELDAIQEIEEEHDSCDASSAKKTAATTSISAPEEEQHRISIYRNLVLIKGGMFTFMSLLGSTQSLSTSDISREIVQVTASCLIVLLQPPAHVAQLDPLTLRLRDAFVAWERMVSLLDYCTACIPSGDDNSADDKIDQLFLLETRIFTLARLACQGCESNKVQFVQSRSVYKIQESAVSSKPEVPGFKAKTGVKVSLDGLSNVSNKKKLLFAGEGHGDDNDKVKVAAIRATADACSLISTLCRYDDSRAEMSSAHDHAMEFHRAGIVPILYNILKSTLSDLEQVQTAGSDSNDEANNTSEPLLLQLAAACMSAVRVTCVNDEIIQHWVAAGLLVTLQTVLSHSGCSESFSSNETERTSTSYPKQRTLLLANTMGVIRNVCGNDEIKTTLCTDQRTIPLLIRYAFQQHRNNASIQEHGCGIIAAMALRSPSNTARMLFAYGVAQEIVLAMTHHPTATKVQRQGSLAIRNMAARAPEVEQAAAMLCGEFEFPSNQLPAVKELLLDLGAERVLRDIAGSLQGSVEEAYAALRDLGCSATMLTYDVHPTTGQKSMNGTNVNARGHGVQMFGDVKPKFRATFEPSVSSEDIDDRIAEHAATNAQ
jgi:hypothetical protein